MKNDILRSVFNGENIDFETFEKRFEEKGGFNAVYGDEIKDSKELERRNSELEKELENVKNESRIDLALSMRRAKNIKAARAVMDDSLIYDENGLNDELLYAQADRLLSENPWLFDHGSSEAKSVSTFLPGGPEKFYDPSRMSDDEYYRKIMKGDSK
jgi:hypothetical protein